ncbi:hypothetical protein [Georgenia sunbinii]|uniref:hypothetical protein n=1 Tax=Georgenia sunbinii TaxID=3117728 RepID=UPI002F26B889
MLGAVVAGGCSADDEAHAGQTETPQAGTATESPSSAAAPVPEALDDAAICTAFGDVLTIVENADLGLADGRMEAQEHEGWHQLATRVLDHLPSAGDSAVHTAIAQLQEIAPTVPSGAGHEPTGVRSPEWDDAMDDLGAVCDGLGAPLAINVFTGG